MILTLSLILAFACIHLPRNVPTGAYIFTTLACIHVHAGDWQTCRGDITKERVTLECNVDALSIFWKVDGCKPRELDWNWGGFENVFTLSGGSAKRIIRWRPSVRHAQFDDDHIVWVPYDTNKKVAVGMQNIVYTRVLRKLKFFQDVEFSDWCPFNGVI